MLGGVLSATKERYGTKGEPSRGKQANQYSLQNLNLNK